MEAIIVICISFIGGVISEMIRGATRKDDGEVWINDERCEVIFRDTYEKLIKKKKVLLKVKS